MFERCILHIGTEKTGTTSIQNFLAGNRDRLLGQGFFYPESLGRTSHVRVAAYAQSDGKMDDTRRLALHRYGCGLAEFRSRLERDLERESAGVDAPCLLVSSEHCHSRLTTTDEKLSLQSFLRSFARTIEVVVYLRRQDRVAVSLFSTRMKSGGTDYDSLLPPVRRRIPYYYDYRAILSGYMDVFGPDNVTVRIFERSDLVEGDAVQDFCRTIGLCDTSSFSPVAHLNESILPVAQKFMSVFNRLNPPFVNGAPNRMRGDIASILQKSYSGKGRTIARAEAVGFVERFVSSNEWVRDRFFPGRPTLFSTDFSEYPEALAEEAFGFEDAVEIAVRLWNEKMRETLEAAARGRNGDAPG